MYDYIVIYVCYYIVIYVCIYVKYVLVCMSIVYIFENGKIKIDKFNIKWELLRKFMLNCFIYILCYFVKIVMAVRYI